MTAYAEAQEKVQQLYAKMKEFEGLVGEINPIVDKITPFEERNGEYSVIQPTELEALVDKYDHLLAVLPYLSNQCQLSQTRMKGIIASERKARPRSGESRERKKRKGNKNNGGNQGILPITPPEDPLDTNLTVINGPPYPHLCGCKPLPIDYTVPMKFTVAFMVPHTETRDWLLGSIVSYSAETEKYTVLDADDSERNHGKKYAIPRDHFTPLPTCIPAVFNRDTVFSKGRTVYALFFNTTCFYRAKVIAPPRSTDDYYLLEFEEDEDEAGALRRRRVCPRFVIAIPPIMKR